MMAITDQAMHFAGSTRSSRCASLCVAARGCAKLGGNHIKSTGQEDFSMCITMMEQNSLYKAKAKYF
jgi:hypothetical protein